MKQISTIKIVGLFGYPLTHTFSPPMHNAAFKALGLDYLYLPFEVKPEDLAAAVAGLAALGIVGVNVTIPHKEKIMEYLDEIDEDAQLIGAANTVYNKDGKLIGYNTDGYGFIQSLKISGEQVENRRVIIIGAGGGARAVAIALAQEKVSEILIFNRTHEKAQKIASLINQKIKPTLAKAFPLDENLIKDKIKNTQILINATPVGMYPHQDDTPIMSTELLHKNLLVYDLIYNPLKTRLLQAAQSKGARTLNGVGMLVHQGAASFQIWTGCQPPTDLMQKVLTEQLTKKNNY